MLDACWHAGILLWGREGGLGFINVCGCIDSSQLVVWHVGEGEWNCTEISTILSFVLENHKVKQYSREWKKCYREAFMLIDKSQNTSWKDLVWKIMKLALIVCDNSQRLNFKTNFHETFYEGAVMKKPQIWFPSFRALLPFQMKSRQIKRGDSAMLEIASKLTEVRFGILKKKKSILF